MGPLLLAWRHPAPSLLLMHSSIIPTLKQILGGALTVATDILWQEVLVKHLEAIWWQRALKLWNRLVLPHTTLCISPLLLLLTSQQYLGAWIIGNGLFPRMCCALATHDNCVLMIWTCCNVKLRYKYEAAWAPSACRPKSTPHTGC